MGAGQHTLARETTPQWGQTPAGTVKWLPLAPCRHIAQQTPNLTTY